MLLTINANNTNVKFAVCRDGRMIADWRLRTDAQRTADQYVVWLHQLMQMASMSLDQIKGAIIATVVPQSLFHLTMLCEKHLKTTPLVVGDSAVKLGIKVLLDKPAEVGADRLANAIGGHIEYKKPLVVVDFGTATTFDVVDAAGNYVGGSIAPGINLSLDALHNATAKLPRIAVERPARAIGKDTLSAMQSGIFFGYVGLVEGIVARISAEFKAEHHADLEVIATGGLAPLFHGATPVLRHLDQEITTRGLIEIYRRNRG